MDITVYQHFQNNWESQWFLCVWSNWFLGGTISNFRSKNLRLSMFKYWNWLLEPLFKWKIIWAGNIILTMLMEELTLQYWYVLKNFRVWRLMVVSIIFQSSFYILIFTLFFLNNITVYLLNIFMVIIFVGLNFRQLHFPSQRRTILTDE